jgi:O-antigen/teichoic acid export membrane protein
LAGVVASVLLLLWAMIDVRYLPGRKPISLCQLKFVAIKYRQFPMYNLWMTLLDQMTSSLPVILFASIFSSAVAGFFALANNVLRLPMSLVGQAVAQVFFERAARQKHLPKELRRLVITNIKGLALFVVAPSAMVLSFGPSLFAFIFGPSWQQAGLFARLLILGTSLTFVASPVSMLPSVLNQQRVHLSISLIAFAARVGSLWIGGQLASPLLAVALYSMGEALIIVVFIGWLLRYLHQMEKRAAVHPSSELHFEVP